MSRREILSPIITVAVLNDLRDAAMALRKAVAVDLGDATMNRHLLEVVNRLDGYLRTARARKHQGLTADEIEAHALETAE